MARTNRRRVLLVEPNYKNKYPPLGLMKIATYHRNRGDHVRFFKGNLRDLILEDYTREVIRKLSRLDNSVSWSACHPKITTFIKLGRHACLQDLILSSKEYGVSVGGWLRHYRKLYLSSKLPEFCLWDRICVTTLFTFHINISVETIAFCKKMVRKPEDLLVGGVMASLLPEEVESITGISPITGLLDKPGMLDNNDNTVIDELEPDYSILHHTDYVYAKSDGFYGYTTRGCIRKCSFCAVPKLEPEYKPFVPLAKTINRVRELYGDRRNLYLLDNNVLASKNFAQIIQEVKDSGFTKGARFIEDDMLEQCMKRLSLDGENYGYKRIAYRTMQEQLCRDDQKSEETESALINFEQSVDQYTPTAKQLISFYNRHKELFRASRKRFPKRRYVDFNQGVDARLLTDRKMRLLSELPIRPLRIAYDDVADADVYENAVRLAAKHGVRHLSNYMLFNYKDKPIDLYMRLLHNVELSEELELQLYSFPMRYSPIWDSEKMHHGRKYIGKHWNRKFIRSVQCVLNSTKGKIGRKKDFFQAAFGKTEDEFFDIMYMPEAYILARYACRDAGFTEAWRKLFNTLDVLEKTALLPVIESNDFPQEFGPGLFTERCQVLLDHYRLAFNDIHRNRTAVEELCKRTRKLL